MKFLQIIILLSFTAHISFAQGKNLSPIPTPEGTKFFYRHTEEFEVTSVSIAGSFNNWNKSAAYMSYKSDEDYWMAILKLNPGIEYHYKFVINDSIWITDPNAPNVTEDEWRNGIVIPIQFGSPYVLDFNPPQGKRITVLGESSCRLIGVDTLIDEKSISVLLDDEMCEFIFNKNSGELKIIPPHRLEEGEHKVFIQFSDYNGNRNNGHLSKFFLDRFKAKIKTPKFYDSAIMYEVYIRSFHDSDQDGIGDFNGLTAKINYFKELGVNALWLMPFNESTKDHGYNVTNYFSIEKDYGTFKDYFNFLTECKKNGIRVIMDLVINHSDSSHRFFRDAVKKPNSRFSDWYQFTDSMNTTWNHFGIEADMPKFNFEPARHIDIGEAGGTEEVQNYFLEVIKYWIDPNLDGDFSDGVDGIRFDAAKEIPHQFWNKVRKEIKKIRYDFLLLGEVWDGSNYLIPFFEDEMDMCFDYPFYYEIERILKNGSDNKISDLVELHSKIYPANFQMVKFLSNHDNHRALSFFDNDTSKLFQALTMIFTLPGTPMIYYGDEIGMQGKTPPENVRKPKEWNLVNDFSDNKIFDFYKSIINLRNSHKVLSRRHDEKIRSFRSVNVKDSEVIAYLRYDKREKFLVLINNSESVKEKNLFSDKSFSNKNGKVIFSKQDLLNTKSYSTILLKNLILLPRDFLVLKILN